MIEKTAQRPNLSQQMQLRPVQEGQEPGQMVSEAPEAESSKSSETGRGLRIELTPQQLHSIDALEITERARKFSPYASEANEILGHIHQASGKQDDLNVLRDPLTRVYMAPTSLDADGEFPILKGIGVVEDSEIEAMVDFLGRMTQAADIGAVPLGVHYFLEDVINGMVRVDTSKDSDGDKTSGKVQQDTRPSTEDDKTLGKVLAEDGRKEVARLETTGTQNEMGALEEETTDRLADELTGSGENGKPKTYQRGLFGDPKWQEELQARHKDELKKAFQELGIEGMAGVPHLLQLTQMCVDGSPPPNEFLVRCYALRRSVSGISDDNPGKAGVMGALDHILDEHRQLVGNGKLQYDQDALHAMSIHPHVGEENAVVGTDIVPRLNSIVHPGSIDIQYSPNNEGFPVVRTNRKRSVPELVQMAARTMDLETESVRLQRGLKHLSPANAKASLMALLTDLGVGEGDIDSNDITFPNKEGGYSPDEVIGRARDIVIGKGMHNPVGTTLRKPELACFTSRLFARTKAMRRDEGTVQDLLGGKAFFKDFWGEERRFGGQIDLGDLLTAHRSAPTGRPRHYGERDWAEADTVKVETDPVALVEQNRPLFRGISREAAESIVEPICGWTKELTTRTAEVNHPIGEQPDLKGLCVVGPPGSGKSHNVLNAIEAATQRLVDQGYVVEVYPVDANAVSRAGLKDPNLAEIIGGAVHSVAEKLKVSMQKAAEIIRARGMVIGFLDDGGKALTTPSKEETVGADAAKSIVRITDPTGKNPVAWSYTYPNGQTVSGTLNGHNVHFAITDTFDTRETKQQKLVAEADRKLAGGRDGTSNGGRVFHSLDELEKQVDLIREATERYDFVFLPGTTPDDLKEVFMETGERNNNTITTKVFGEIATAMRQYDPTYRVSRLSTDEGYFKSAVDTLVAALTPDLPRRNFRVTIDLTKAAGRWIKELLRERPKDLERYFSVNEDVSISWNFTPEVAREIISHLPRKKTNGVQRLQ